MTEQLESKRPQWPVARARRRAIVCRSLPELLFAVAALSVLVWVASDAFGVRIATHSPESDYWEHTAALRALLAHPFRPENPQLVSDASSPRFGPHFVLLALFGRLLGFDAFQTMGLAAVLNTALFLAGIDLFFRAYFKSRLAPLFGLIVMLGSWSNAPNFSNVYQLSVLFSVASYPSTAALGLTWFGFAFTLRALQRDPSRRLQAFLIVLWGYVFATHQLTAVFGLSGALLLALTDDGVARRRRLIVSALPVLGVALAAFWPLYSTFDVIFRGTSENVGQALAGGVADTPQRFLRSRSAWEILGVAALGLPVLPYFAVKRRHGFIVFGCLAMLAPFLAAAFVPIPLGHRFLLFAVFYLQLALVWLLLRLIGEEEASKLRAKGHAKRGWVLVVALLGYCVLTNLSRARQRFSTLPKQSESPTLRFARKVAELSGPEAVILASRKASWALPAFGPKVVALHHENPLVRDGAERLRQVGVFYAPDTADDERDAILERYGVTAVIVTPDTQFLASFLRHRGDRLRLPEGRWLYLLG